MWMNRSLTKRQLGWLCLGSGGLLLAGGLAADLLHAGRFAGFGPVQQQIGLAAVGLIVFGCTLLPFGNRPA
jgi:hypothetical protein